MQSLTVGWIGLGKMGVPMAGRLLQAALPLTVFNRNIMKADALIALGADVADSPAQVIRQSDVAILMVSDDIATRVIFEGPHGLLDAGRKGNIIINMSTVSPGISRELSKKCRDKGMFYLDAPVSGSVRQAEDGQLVIMVGGDEDAFTKAKPVLDHLGKLVMRVGDSGAGNTAKLAINMLLSFHALGLAEAAVFAKQHGISSEALFTLINNSALGNAFMRIKGEAIVHDNFKVAFALKHIAKDLRLARTEGWTTPLAETAYKTFEAAEPRYGEEDIIAVIRQLAG